MLNESCIIIIVAHSVIIAKLVVDPDLAGRMRFKLDASSGIVQVACILSGIRVACYLLPWIAAPPGTTPIVSAGRPLAKNNTDPHPHLAPSPT